MLGANSGAKPIERSEGPVKNAFRNNVLVSTDGDFAPVWQTGDAEMRGKIALAEMATQDEGGTVVGMPKRGPGRPPGHPKTGGRRKGTPNRLTRDAKAAVLNIVDPNELLARIAAGHKLSCADPDNPGRKVRVYPTKAERIAAATVLSHKFLPSLKSQELSGPDGGPISTHASGDGGPRSEFETARAIAFALASGDPARATSQGARPRPAAAPRGWRVPEADGETPASYPRGHDDVAFGRRSGQEPAPEAVADEVVVAMSPKLRAVIDELREPDDSALVGRVQLARYRNHTWTAINSADGTLIDPSMAEAFTSDVERRVREILADRESE